MPSSHSPTVQGGRLRGRRLDVPAGRVTRPTRALVRAALFDMLGPGVAGASVLDLYSGSGALGIEALSRGAARVLLVERDRRVLPVLRANLARLELAEPEAVLLALDARQLPAGAPGRPYDLVLADPPFAAAARSLPEALEQPGVLAEDAVLAAHLPTGQAEPRPGPAWNERRRRVHGRSTLVIWERIPI